MFEAVANGFLSDLVSNVQPRDCRPGNHILECKMSGIIGADRDLCARFGNDRGLPQHELGNTLVVGAVERRHPLTHRDATQSHLRVPVFTHELRRVSGDLTET